MELIVLDILGEVSGARRVALGRDIECRGYTIIGPVLRPRKRHILRLFHKVAEAILSRAVANRYANPMAIDHPLQPKGNAFTVHNNEVLGNNILLYKGRFQICSRYTFSIEIAA